MWGDNHIHSVSTFPGREFNHLARRTSQYGSAYESCVLVHKKH